MLTRNLKSFKLTIPSLKKFSNRDFEWMDSPFICRPEIPPYIHIYYQIEFQQLNSPRQVLPNPTRHFIESSEQSAAQIARDEAAINGLISVGQRLEDSEDEKGDGVARGGGRRRVRSGSRRMNKK